MDAGGRASQGAVAEEWGEGAALQRSRVIEFISSEMEGVYVNPFLLSVGRRPKSKDMRATSSSCRAALRLRLLRRLRSARTAGSVGDSV